ncbi:MAG: ABC transporter ATP-binding protein [Candidatus Tectomicrobia bacterium]|uniref:ABC transporter ATP-binding protein n=1 Tax=Tectimicrobiota bacterium TaxID=2528274 RepID=A0A932I050_UNCTE|nr:ABC transporter ATP-binding protein [Candidatus Tectomicrobia bacterium]
MELAIEGLRKRFGEAVLAVDGVSFRVSQGEFLVLLGPSGCGKTTTLRCVAGFEEPDAGRILIGGAPMTDAAQGIMVPPERRNLGMVFQSYAIWPHMTVFENVAYGLVVKRHPREGIRRKVKEKLALVGLSGMEERPATALSGGQMQRVALARSLANEPGILLLDEPLSNLDAKLRASLRFELKEIQRKTGVTALYVTHDQAEAVVLGDRIAVMNAGRIMQLADPVSLYNRPSNRFVAEFTGATNFLRGRLEWVKDGEGVVRLAEGMELRCAAPGAPAPGSEVELSLRPENIFLEPAGNSAGGRRNVWPAEVVKADFLGTHSVYRVKMGEETLTVIENGSWLRYQPESTVSLFVPPERVSLLQENGPA